MNKKDKRQLEKLRKAVQKERDRLHLNHIKFSVQCDNKTKKVMFAYLIDFDKGLDIKNNRLFSKKRERLYVKNATIYDVDFIVNNLKRKVYKDLDNCSHTKYDYERRTTKIYKNIQSEVGSNTEIVLRRYKNSQTGKSHYQIVKYFLCNHCNDYRICKGMSAIDLTHKDFKELIDGYIKSI